MKTTGASGSAVEHLLAKERVAGSIPVSRSWQIPWILYTYIEFVVLLKFFKKLLTVYQRYDIIHIVVRNTADKREWLSGGASPCQGEGRGFDSRLALFHINLQSGFCS